MKSIKYLNEDKEKIKKYAEPDNPLQNMADHVGLTQIDAQIEILKEVLEEFRKEYEIKCKEQGLKKDEWNESEMFSINEIEQKITGDEE